MHTPTNQRSIDRTQRGQSTKSNSTLHLAISTSVPSTGTFTGSIHYACRLVPCSSSLLFMAQSGYNCASWPHQRLQHADSTLTCRALASQFRTSGHHEPSCQKSQDRAIRLMVGPLLLCLKTIRDEPRSLGDKCTRQHLPDNLVLQLARRMHGRLT